MVINSFVKKVINILREIIAHNKQTWKSNNPEKFLPYHYHHFHLPVYCSLSPFVPLFSSISPFVPESPSFPLFPFFFFPIFLPHFLLFNCSPLTNHILARPTSVPVWLRENAHKSLESRVECPTKIRNNDVLLKDVLWCSASRRFRRLWFIVVS